MKFISWFYKNHKKEIFLFLLTFTLELVMIFALSRINGIEVFFRGDGRDYQNLANNLIDRQTLAITSHPPYLPTSFRTPIYPFWLAFIYLIFRSYNAAIFIGALVFAISTPLVYLIGREIFTEKIAFISALIFSLEPWAIYQAGFLAAEQIFIPMFLFSIYLFLFFIKFKKTPYLYWASLILGIAVLTRPVVLAFIVIFVFLVFISELKSSIRQAFKVSIMTFLIFILVLSPWFIRNKIVLDTWQFSSASGLNIFGNYLMLEKYLGRFDAKDDIYEKAKQLVGAKNDIEAITTVENSKKLSDIAIKGISSYPGSFLTMHFLNAIPLFFLKNSYGNILFDFRIPISGLSKSELLNKSLINFLPFVIDLSIGVKFLIFLSLFWPVIIFLIFFGILKQFKQSSRSLLFWLLILWILYFSVLLAGARDISRYKLAINAPLFLFAVTGFFLIKDYIHNYAKKI